MLLHRICAAEFGSTAQAAFSGQGGVYGSGRWHQRGRPIVYTAAHRSLALLEIMVHLDARWPLQPMVAWEIEVPEPAIRIPADLPADWKSNLQGTRAYGEKWLSNQESAALRVPSVIVPAEFNVLLNPAHPDFRLDWVRSGPESVEIDPRLL